MAGRFSADFKTKVALKAIKNLKTTELQVD